MSISRHHQNIVDLVVTKHGAQTSDFGKNVLRAYLEERAEEFISENGTRLRSFVPDAYSLEKITDENEMLTFAFGMPVRYRLIIYEVEITSFLGSKLNRYALLCDELAGYGIEVVIKTVDRYGNEIEHDMVKKYWEEMDNNLGPLK